MDLKEWKTHIINCEICEINPNFIDCDNKE